MLRLYTWLVCVKYPRPCRYLQVARVGASRSSPLARLFLQEEIRSQLDPQSFCDRLFVERIRAIFHAFPSRMVSQERKSDFGEVARGD